MKKLLTPVFVFLMFLLAVPSAYSQTDSTKVDKPIYVDNVDHKPTYNGADVQGFANLVNEFVEYPLELAEKKIEGTVSVSFVVDKNGKVGDIKELRSPHRLMTLAVVYVLNQLQPWEPGRDKGKPVATCINLYVKFSANKLTPEKLAKLREKSKNAVPDDDVVLEYTPKEDLPKLNGSEVFPVFKKGGLEEFRQWVMGRISYPEYALEKKIEGVVIVTFVVEKNGRLGDIILAQGVHKLLDKEVMRVVSSSPKWKSPGYEHGKPVRVKFTLPINFALQ